MLLGYSDSGPSPRTARRIASELAELLVRGGIDGPPLFVDPFAISLLIVVSIFVGRALGGQLFEVRPADPLALGTAALVFGVVSLLICLLPATRAAKTDLLAALHQD